MYLSLSIHPIRRLDMHLNARERDMLFSRLRVFGVPREISVSFLRDIERWIDCSGLEWTITRLKDIKNDIVRKEAGLEPVSSWIRKNPSSQFIFKGSVKALEKWGRTRFQDLVQVLNIYTSFYAPSVTKKQVEKFVSGVTSTPVDVSYFVPIVITGKKLAGITSRRLSKGKPLLTRTPTETRAPSPFGSQPEDLGIIDSVAFLHMDGKRHYEDYFMYYDPVLEGLEPEILCFPPELGELYRGDLGGLPVIGKIGIIQEPGYKLRAVANPGRVFQQVLQPLGDSLFSILSALPWDCTFEQSKADPWISRRLAAGGTVYSVDLSGATDYFPLNLQLELLRTIFPTQGKMINLFRDISTGWWHHDLPQEYVDDVSPGNPEGFLRWTKGQPLGLYPSFASFALTHGLLLLGLLGKPWEGEFFVLGDDVVILDQSLYSQYRDALRRLGCPVSDAKTLISDKVAEFRSRIVTPKASIPQLKWRNPSDDNFLDVVRLLGMRGVVLLSKRQRKVVLTIGSVPEFAGGLGWNPCGKPLADRLGPFLTLLLKEYLPVERLTDYSWLARRRLNSSYFSELATRNLPGSVSRNLEFLPILDQRSVQLVSETLGASLVPLWSQLGRNLDLVLEGNLDLPTLGVPKRWTVLQKWESLLRSIWDGYDRVQTQ